MDGGRGATADAITLVRVPTIMKCNKGSIGRKSENFFKIFENLYFKYVAKI